MRTLLLVVLLTTEAFGQVGIPIDFGTHVLPEGLAGETNIKFINQKRIEVLRLANQVVQDRYRAGLVNIDFLLKAQSELVEAQLESTTISEERLEHIENGLKAALLTWQTAQVMQTIGARGGEADNEVLSRAAVFRFRAMWLKEKALLTTAAFGHEGIPVDIGTKVLPEGLAGETDIKVINQKRIEALQSGIQTAQDRNRDGLVNIDVSLKAKIELVEAQLETTTNREERLEHIENGLKAALLTWQLIKEKQRMGARGGEADNEVLSRAAVFRFRAMWLKEKALLTTAAFGQEGIPIGFGTKVLPEGLVGESDIKVINQKRIEALQSGIQTAQDRNRAGLINLVDIDVLLKAQIELVEAQLETSTNREERLKHLENGLKAALLTWQLIKEKQKMGARGGEADIEVLSRAAVFRFRAMWLKEKASN